MLKFVFFRIGIFRLISVNAKLKFHYPHTLRPDIDHNTMKGDINKMKSKEMHGPFLLNDSTIIQVILIFKQKICRPTFYLTIIYNQIAFHCHHRCDRDP